MIRNALTYDIAIIGAGPAGCSAALSFGKSGYRVVLLDKDNFPREKVCGDGIPGPAIKALDTAFPFFKDEFKKPGPKQVIRSSRIMLKSGRSISYNWVLPAYNIKREIFDDFLLRLVKKYAEVDVLTNFEATHIIRGQESIIKSTEQKKEITARIIIDCSGSASITSGSTINQEPETSSQKLGAKSQVFAVRAYYRDLNLDANTNYFWVDKKFLPGYFWAFPLPGGEFNVGFGIMTGKKGKVEKNPKDALAHFTGSDWMAHIFGDARALSIPKGAIIPVGGEKNLYSDAGFLIAGDAASLADPLQGHGIDKAVVSGMLAARQAMRCFEANDFSSDFISGYDTMIRIGLERELRKNRNRMKILSAAPLLLDLYSFFKKT